MSYRVVENKTANIIGNIGLSIFLSAFLIGGLGLVSYLFFKEKYLIYPIAYFFLSLPVVLVFIGIASFFSTKDKDTSLFLNEIRQSLKNCKSINDLIIVRKYLIHEAFDENNMIRISYPTSVKSLIKEIDCKIEILKVYENNLPNNNRNKSKAVRIHNGSR